jgi:hypothetical protein
VPTAVLGITAAGIIFGEIRLITGSTWPALIMHAVNNAVIAVVLTGGFFQVARQTGFLFTPGMGLRKSQKCSTQRLLGQFQADFAFAIFDGRLPKSYLNRIGPNPSDQPLTSTVRGAGSGAAGCLP